MLLSETAFNTYIGNVSDIEVTIRRNLPRLLTAPKIIFRVIFSPPSTVAGKRAK